MKCPINWRSANLLAASHAKQTLADGLDIMAALVLDEPCPVLTAHVATTLAAFAGVRSNPKRFVIAANTHDATSFNTDPV